jgi:hypothetical protein
VSVIVSVTVSVIVSVIVSMIVSIYKPRSHCRPQIQCFDREPDHESDREPV